MAQSRVDSIHALTKVFFDKKPFFVDFPNLEAQRGTQHSSLHTTRNRGFLVHAPLRCTSSR